MEDKYTEFAKKFSPSLYRRLKKVGVKNVDAAHDYMLRQLAFESGWGNSAVAKKYNNYAGWGHKVVDGKHTYSLFKDSEDFLDTWVPGMLSRYRSAIDAPTLNDYATNLKKKGYYEDSLEHYMQTLNGMGRATRAAAALRQSNPELYADIEPEIPVRNFAMLDKPYMQPADNTRVIKPTQIQYNKTLPDTEVIGYKRKTLQAPTIASLWDTLRQAVEYNLLKAAGMVPEDNNDDYTNMFIKPTLGLPHFAGGKDGWTPDQGWTVTRRDGKSYVSLGQPKEPTTKRPYWVTARTKQLDYDDLEKGYTAATAGMLPNYLTAARNLVQGDIQKSLVNLGMTADTQLTPDGTTYAIVAPGILDADVNTAVNAARSFNDRLRRREDLQLAEEIFRRDIMGRHAEDMFRIWEQPRLYGDEVEREALEQGIDNILSNPTIQQRGVNPVDWDWDDMDNLRDRLFPQSRWSRTAYRETLKDLYERWSGNSAEGVSFGDIENYLNENVFDIHPRTADVPDVPSNIGLTAQNTSGKPSGENLPEHLRNRPEIKQNLPAGSKTFDYQMDSKEVLKNAKTTFDRMPSGAYYSLIKDGDLSTDSYTLLESLSRRWGDKVKIKIPRNPDGSVRMQKLNSLGKRRKLDDVKLAVQSLSRTTGVELPEVYSDGYRIFVPSFLLIKK